MIDDVIDFAMSYKSGDYLYRQVIRNNFDLTVREYTAIMEWLTKGEEFEPIVWHECPKCGHRLDLFEYVYDEYFFCDGCENEYFSSSVIDNLVFKRR